MRECNTDIAYAHVFCKTCILQNMYSTQQMFWFVCRDARRSQLLSHSGTASELLQSFQIAFLDVLTGAAITTKIAACCMYMCFLPVLED